MVYHAILNSIPVFSLRLPNCKKLQDPYYMKPNQQTIIVTWMEPDLKYTDIIVDSLLLVLCYALGDPCDVADFLIKLVIV
jgi:hypothetical protein